MTSSNPEPPEDEVRGEIRHFWWLLGFLTLGSFGYHFWLEMAWP